MPFGKYNSFKDCVKKNQDKKNPESYCAAIEEKITGKYPGNKKKVDYSKMTDETCDVIKETEKDFKEIKF